MRFHELCHTERLQSFKKILRSLIICGIFQFIVIFNIGNITHLNGNGWIFF